MAATSSMIIDDNQPDQIFSPPADNESQAKTESISSNPASADLLAEILAIQESIQNEVNFDFTSLEATSAGNSQDTSGDLGNRKTVSSPVMFEEPNILIQYRSDESRSTNSSSQDYETQTESQNLETNNDSSLLSFTESKLTNIQSSLSEDFITKTQGKFASNLTMPEQNIETAFGLFTSDGSGNWFYTLNNQLPEIQALTSGASITDLINLTSTTGQKVQIALEINGTNDQAIVIGTKSGEIQATPIEELTNNHPSISGKLDVSDVDAGEARFQTNFDIQGSFGVAQINALGEWTYTLNNHSDAVQGLRTGEKLLDLFSIKTLDGTKQLIQINIEGIDDKPLLSGSNASVLDLDSSLTTSGKLLINDPDFGESSFQQLSGIRSSLGYGIADIDAQGKWTFNLDVEYTKLNTIDEGQTVRDNFEAFTMDGTSQSIIVSIRGSDSPFYETSSAKPMESEFLALNDLIQEETTNDIAAVLSEGNDHATNNYDTYSLANNQSLEASVFMNNSQDGIQALNTNLNDIHIS